MITRQWGTCLAARKRVMNRHSAQNSSPSPGPEHGELERILRATRELAEYARAQNFPGADELLEAVAAALLAPSPERSHQNLIAAEKRAIDAIRATSKLTEPED
jgi:hypothetical protein